MFNCLATPAVSYDPETKRIAGLEPCHFITMATPHLGCDDDGVAQVKEKESWLVAACFSLRTARSETCVQSKMCTCLHAAPRYTFEVCSRSVMPSHWHLPVTVPVLPVLFIFALLAFGDLVACAGPLHWLDRGPAPSPIPAECRVSAHSRGPVQAHRPPVLPGR
jgi:hypothetical protein